MRVMWRLVMVWALVAGLGAQAQAAPYFEAASVPPTLLAPPPATHGEVWKAEIESMVALQARADENAIARAADERNMSPEMLVLETMPQLTRQAFPKTYALLDRVGDTSYAVTKQAKSFWNTRRPYLMDSRIKALIEAHDNPAYPSGHTSGSYVWAHAMSMIIPEKRAEFMARAEEIAQHRVLVGMHYPHDIEGGKALALLIVGSLLQNKSFIADMEAAKKELFRRDSAH